MGNRRWVRLLFLLCESSDVSSSAQGVEVELEVSLGHKKRALLGYKGTAVDKGGGELSHFGILARYSWQY